jgi:hypothetical protein
MAQTILATYYQRVKIAMKAKDRAPYQFGILPKIADIRQRDGKR